MSMRLSVMADGGVGVIATVVGVPSGAGGGGGCTGFAGGGSVGGGAVTVGPVGFGGGGVVVFPGGGGVAAPPLSSCFCSCAIFCSTSTRLCALGEFRR